MIIGRFDAAKIEFEQGKRLNPKSAEMPYNLGKLYSIQDNWADARGSLKRLFVWILPIWRRMTAWDSLSRRLARMRARWQTTERRSN